MYKLLIQWCVPMTSSQPTAQANGTVGCVSANLINVICYFHCLALCLYSGVTQPLGALPPLLHFGDLPPPVAKKISVSVPFWESKKFSGHTPISPKYDKIFPETPKNVPDIFYFSPKLKHFSRNPRNVLSNFLWSFLSGAPKVRRPPVTGHPDTLPLRHCASIPDMSSIL